jgi:molybdopterin synthase sulfur carrier subunit
MKIHLRFFASIREALGVANEDIDLPTEIETIADLRTYLIDRGSPWAETLANEKVLRCALNQQMVKPDTKLQNDAEVAFFPPVTGG